jgi:hypothetical protein
MMSIWQVNAISFRYFSHWKETLKSGPYARLFVIVALIGGIGVFRVPTASAQFIIHTITVFTNTADLPNADTDATVYLGLGGREFNLNNPRVNDFQRGALNKFVLGPLDPNNVVNPDLNNPAKGLPLILDDIIAFPVYIRLDGTDGWIPTNVEILINGPDSPDFICQRAIPEPDHFVLDSEVGQKLYILCRRPR